jgi:hypothetical protein
MLGAAGGQWSGHSGIWWKIIALSVQGEWANSISQGTLKSAELTRKSD